MVQNQQAINALWNYINNFSILNYAGQDVTTACGRIKAIARALDDQLPTNAVQRVLRGMALASSWEFVTTVETMAAAANCSFLVGDDIKQKSTYKKLVLVLDNLNELYIGLHTERMWAGAGHEARAFSILPSVDTSCTPSVPTINMSTVLQDHLSTFTTFDAAEIYATGKGIRLSHDDWAKLQTCHHCGVRGHIRPNCPKWKALPREDRHTPHNRQNRQSHYSKGHHNVDRRQQHDKGRIRSGTGQGNKLHNFSDRDRRHLQRAARILSALQDDQSDGESSSPSSSSSDDDSADDNSFHAKVAGALSGALKNW